MAATSTANTMAESLNKLVGQIAQMMTMPDADLQFLTQLQMQITDYVRNSQAQAAQPQSAVPGGAGGPMPMGGGGVGASPPAGMMGGASMGAPMPNMDELTRMLSRTSGGQGG